MDINTTESNNPDTQAIDVCDTLQMLRMMNNEDAKVAAAVREQLPQVAKAVDAIVARFRQDGRLFYVGAGTSGRLGILDASECPPTFHTPPDMIQAAIAGGEAAIRMAVENAEDDEEAGRKVVADYGMLPQDVMVGITASGITPYVLAAVEAAKAAGLCTIGLSCNAGSPLSRLAQIAITPVVGPEAIQGSTRLKAGTAQKLVLNMLSTGSMIRLGKVYGNQMVDLVPSNNKLRDRAKRIIMDATGADYAMAADYFHWSGQNTKCAIAMLKLGCSLEEAQRLLKENNGRLADFINTT